VANVSDTLIHYGDAVKAIGDDGRVGGYLVRFSDAAAPDISRERDFFTSATDFDVEDGDRKSVYYAHGLDATMGVKRIGIATVKTDDVGVWVEAQLRMRDDYEKHIFALAKKGKLGWSSGAPAHLVTRKAVDDAHEVLTWNISEASLTPTPAEPRNDCIALKSLGAMIGMDASDATKTEEAIATDPMDAQNDTEEIKTATPPASVPFDAQIDAALAAVDGVIQRGFDINDLRIKSGRVLSAANRSKLADLHGKMKQTHGEMSAHLEAINNLLLSTDPDKAKRDATKQADEIGVLRMQFIRLQSRHLGLIV